MSQLDPYTEKERLNILSFVQCAVVASHLWSASMYFRCFPRGECYSCLERTSPGHSLGENIEVAKRLETALETRPWCSPIIP